MALIFFSFSHKFFSRILYAFRSNHVKVIYHLKNLFELHNEVRTNESRKDEALINNSLFYS